MSNWSRALKFWEEHLPPNINNAHVLELGAHGGGLSLYFAHRGCDVVCSDISEITELARTLHRKHGLHVRMTYARIDATSIPYKDEAFDIVVFKSLLGAIGRHNQPDRQRQAIGEMHRVLKPGGHLLFAENQRGSPMHRLLRQWLVPWGKQWHYITPNGMDQLLGQFESTRVGAFGFWGALGRTEWQRKLLAFPDRAICPLVPAGWRYILYGVAKK